jgi:D-glycero-D-manno-heptose 1,7-bisphosphate phosphatase
VRRAVFLDRDGVINANVQRDGKPVAPTTLAEFRILPGVEDAIRRLKEAGFLIVIATNQPDLRTGRTPQSEVDAMHAEIRRRVPVDAIKVCAHIDSDECDCRKPKPGMLLEAARELNIDLPSSFMVGDRWKDIAAGQAAGCLTFLVEYGYEQRNPIKADTIVLSLPEAADVILGLKVVVKGDDYGHSERKQPKD